jgi:hypothetical protein
MNECRAATSECRSRCAADVAGGVKLANKSYRPAAVIIMMPVRKSAPESARRRLCMGTHRRGLKA